MSLTSILGPRSLRSGATSVRRRRAARPRLETLEDRTVLSTLTVTNTNDNGPGSLRYEIGQANSGDTINFANSLTGQTITLTSGELQIAQNLTIAGSGETINGNHASRDLEVDSATVAISGLTFANGKDDGDVTFGGGGILNWGGTLTVSNCVFANNSANFGGAIENFGASPVLSPSLFSPTAVLTVTNCLFAGNSATAPPPTGYTGPNDLGGALQNYSNVSATSAILTVSGSVFVGNSAGSGGGVNNQGGTETVNNCLLTANTASVQGGGINTFGVALTVSNSIVLGNLAPVGKGADLYKGGGTVTLQNDIIGITNSA
jgi:hypothetical protein